MRWRGSGPAAIATSRTCSSDPECRRRDGGLRVVVTTDVGLRGLGEANPATGRRPLRRADGRGVRRRRRRVRRPPPCPWSPGSGSTARGASRRASDGPGRRSRLAAERREDDRVRWTTLAMAGLATVALEQAMLEPGRSRAVALAWTAGAAHRPDAGRRWWLVRRQCSRTAGGPSPAARAAIRPRSSPCWRSSPCPSRARPRGWSSRAAARWRRSRCCRPCGTWGSASPRWPTGRPTPGSRRWSACSW